jgi:sRNA-binding regulator protein Hfq
LLREPTANSPRVRNAQVRREPFTQAGFLSAFSRAPEVPPRQAELFYLQKQIQAQTPMVIVLEDGEKLEGTIDWYDRDTIKIRGRARTLIYKSAIKYMYKKGDPGQ